jgi:TonB-linked SusC/RagA family outer membrane protein
MKKVKILFLILPLLLLSVFTFAQTKVIAGKVLDQKTGDPLGGASVRVDKTSAGVSSNSDGTYSITVPSNSKSLIFSFVGHEDLTVPISNQTVIDISLVSKVASNEEVIVVGYGTSRKKYVTGAIGSISAKDFDKTAVTRADQYIQGRVSGVQVIQTNQAPGGNVSIRIRGTNSINSGNEPLFVIDGFPGAGDLNSINPNDIESIEVLKDASATAIYGTRGANGVILVTTKKGKAGRQAIKLDAYYGVQKVVKTYDMMNAKEFATYADSVVVQNNRINNTSTALPFTSAQIDALGEGTNWQDEVLQAAPMSSYQISLGGGTPETKYYLSLNYFNQEGIIINSWFKRGTVRYNFDKIISSKIKMGITSQLGITSENAALVNTNGGAQGGVMYDATRFSPVLPVKDSTGAYTYSNGPATYFVPAGNPVQYAMDAQDKRTNLNTLVNSYFEYEFITGLKYNLTAGATINNFTRDFYLPSYLYQTSQNTSTGAAIKSSGTTYSWLVENTINYDKEIAQDQHINAVAGLSFQKYYQQGFSAAANAFFTDQLGYNNLSIGSVPLVPTSNAQDYSLASYFGRINYRYKDKYLVTFTLRADGSSRFGSGNKWGYFPSGAFAWRMIEEDFIRNLNFFSDLKLRFGMGTTGNQEIGSYQSLSQYAANSSYTLGGNRVVGVSSLNIPNPDLSWESTTSTDIGIDFGLLKGTLTGTIDFYTKKTNDLLFNSYIPTSTGYDFKLINAGSVINRGIEIGLNWAAINHEKFGWTIGGNLSVNKNHVDNLNGTNNLLAGKSSTNIFIGGGQPTSILEVGQPIGSFYGYTFNGIWQSQKQIAESGIKTKVLPGDPIYVDTNNDSLITGADRTIIGNALPRFTYGFTNNFRYQRWNLNFLMLGVSGVDILNENLYELENGFTTTNKIKSVTEAWHGEGTSNTQARVSSVMRRGTGITSEAIEDGSYFRLKTITLGYDFNMGDNKVIKAINLYVTCQNLFTITNYSGYDPEVNSYGNNSNANNLSLNTDYNSYPASKSFIFGIRMGF